MGVTVGDCFDSLMWFNVFINNELSWLVGWQTRSMVEDGVVNVVGGRGWQKGEGVAEGEGGFWIFSFFIKFFVILF